MSRVSLIPLACVVLALAGAKPQTESRDIVNTALTVHKFNTFLSLLRDADLTLELQRPGPFTVFIPTDEAFERTLGTARIEALRWNKASARRLLLHHVVRGRYDAESIAKRGSIQPLEGAALRTAIVAGRGQVGGARFVVPNVQTSNGLIHGIDRVLEP